MKLAIIAFDDFTDIDVFLMWDLLKRVRIPNWEVKILGDKPEHTSTTGLRIPMHGGIQEAKSCDVVLFASGPGTRVKYLDKDYLGAFELDPKRQMIGSMCSGALILAAMGLLKDSEATTYPTAKNLLESLGVKVVEKAFVQKGNVATAAGCLAAQYLIGWVIEKKISAEMSRAVIKSIQPVGAGLDFADTNLVQQMYAQAKKSDAQ